MLDRMQALDAATAVRHAVFAEFVQFPRVTVDAGLRVAASDFLMACETQGAIALLTVETLGGLDTYRREDVEALADLLARFHVPILLRWNHEFNGGWYLWSRQPGRYVERFREAAAVMHASAPNVAMVWAPNAQDAGYPWAGDTEVPLPLPGTDDFAALDSDADGVIDARDDAYGAYYPGDTYVDWVGLSAYATGRNPKDGTENWNIVPPEGMFRATIQTFHDRYAAGKHKPMVIAETAAVFDPDDTLGGGATELAIKSAWIDQVFGPLGVGSPGLRGVAAVLWFSQQKPLAANKWTTTPHARLRDERIHSNPAVASAYRRAIEAGPFAQGPAVDLPPTP